jgi:kinetochore protein NNF1
VVVVVVVLLMDGYMRDDEADEGCRPHTLSAEELYRAYLAPGLVEVEGLLEEKLKVSRERNLEVGEDVQRQRVEIEMLMATLEGRVKDLEGAVGAMEEDSLGADLRREIGEMEGELRLS